MSETYEQAKESIADGAAAVGAYAGSNGYTPREPRPERAGGRGRPPYDRRGGDRGSGDRGGRGGYVGDRGSYGGDRGMQRDRNGGGRSFEAAERILTPTPGIYVGNLLFDVTTADLEREFGQFGKIISTTIATDGRGLSKGYVPLCPNLMSITRRDHALITWL